MSVQRGVCAAVKGWENFLQFHQGFSIFHVHIIETRWCVSIRIGLEGVRIDYTFVKHQSISFGAKTHFELFGGRMSGEEIGIDDVDVSAFIKRIRQLLQKVLTHDVVVELLLTTNIEGEPSHFAAHFAVFGLVSIILWSC